MKVGRKRLATVEQDAAAFAWYTANRGVGNRAVATLAQRFKCSPSTALRMVQRARDLALRTGETYRKHAAESIERDQATQAERGVTPLPR